MKEEDYSKLLEKYKSKIESEFGNARPAVASIEYTQFKQELYPTHYSLYEKACNFSEKLLKLKVDGKHKVELEKDIQTTHLKITPEGAMAFSILFPLMFMVLCSLLFFALFNMLFFVVFSIVAGLIMIFALQHLPTFMATTWRMKASNQMVQSIFYLVTYMRHTSNLERAIEFAADHLDPPLSLDFRKILWDVETQKYSNIRESANAYLEQWKEYNKEFVEAFHLVESSLFEASEERRLSLLDKSLEVVLNGTYENMLHYAHSLQSPITMLHMLGVILPILGLVILPLVVSFMVGEDSSPMVTSIYIAALYNVSLPIMVYYLGKVILSKRPSGYGASDIADASTKVSPGFIALVVLGVCLVLGFSPLVLHFLNPTYEITIGEFKMMHYICPPSNANCTDKLGPFGLGASLLSLLVVLGLGVSSGLYYALRSRNVIKIRERTKALEDEFSSALFQLGNRLGDGIPAEIAFAKVAQTMKGTTSGDFFALAERNITHLGMGLEQSLFHPKAGAVVSFPSKVIESSMKVLIESIKKGPRIAAQALLSMSSYIKEIHRVEERLKDLMAEVISSMNSQVKFLTPAIAGIVVGITSMISAILIKLSGSLGDIPSDQVSSLGGVMDIFGVGIPTYYFQIIVGIYVVQIGYILTVLSNGIENGADKLGERYKLGQNLINGTLLYCFICAVVMVLFNVFALQILNRTAG